MSVETDALKKRLDLVIGLLICQLPPDKSPQEIMVILDRAGASAGDIAQVLGAAPNTVSVNLHRARKKKARSTGKRKAKGS